MNTAQALTRAAKYIKDNGWAQGSYGSDGGPRCAIGAIRSVTGSKRLRAQAEIALANVVCDSEENSTVAEWNDRVIRTRAQVVAAILLAASREGK